MNIGTAAIESGVSAKMIRHYEAIGLLAPAARRENSYRDYGTREVHELRFIGRARRLGFSIEEIRVLINLWRDGKRPSREVRRVAMDHLQDLETRIAEMQARGGRLTVIEPRRSETAGIADAHHFIRPGSDPALLAALLLALDDAGLVNPGRLAPMASSCAQTGPLGQCTPRAPRATPSLTNPTKPPCAAPMHQHLHPSPCANRPTSSPSG
jgi:Cu(I)-responsive transcriptional regulator